jgi:signal transduction histidine kinase
MRRVLVIESLALLVVLVVTGAIVFVASQGDVITAFPQPYFLFPVLIWASQRFGPRGAALSVFIVSTIAVYGTVLGRGPFAGASIHHSLVELQAFMGVVATTFLVLAADVAERRAAEEDAMQARLLAEEANKAKADFLAVVSHELRTPLNAIAGYTDLLLCQVQGPLNEKQLDSLQRINRNYLHLLSLIDDVLGFTRVETGRLIIRPERVRVVDVIEAVEPMILPEANRKRIALQREPVDASLCVVADPDKMRQIVANLLSNAVKYTETGGHVSITAAASDGRVRIRIADSGIGIPTDQLSRVFDPFYQVERGTTRRFPGIGLGLTIARDLAFAMQGAIDLQSAPGQGTIVTLSFPAS